MEVHCFCCCCMSIKGTVYPRCILGKQNLHPAMPFVRVEQVHDLPSRASSSKVISAAFPLCKQHFKDTSKTSTQYANFSKLAIRTGSCLQLSLCITIVLFVSMPLWELGSLSKHTSGCFLALMPEWINMSAALKQRAAVVHWTSSLRHPSKVGQAFPTGASPTTTLSHLFLHFSTEGKP